MDNQLFLTEEALHDDSKECFDRFEHFITADDGLIDPQNIVFYGTSFCEVKHTLNIHVFPMDPFNRLYKNEINPDKYPPQQQIVQSMDAKAGKKGNKNRTDVNDHCDVHYHGTDKFKYLAYFFLRWQTGAKIDRIDLFMGKAYLNYFLWHDANNETWEIDEEKVLNIFGTELQKVAKQLNTRSQFAMTVLPELYEFCCPTDMANDDDSEEICIGHEVANATTLTEKKMMEKVMDRFANVGLNIIAALKTAKIPKEIEPYSPEFGHIGTELQEICVFLITNQRKIDVAASAWHKCCAEFFEEMWHQWFYRHGIYTKSDSQLEPNEDDKQPPNFNVMPTEQMLIDIFKSLIDEQKDLKMFHDKILKLVGRLEKKVEKNTSFIEMNVVDKSVLNIIGQILVARVLIDHSGKTLIHFVNYGQSTICNFCANRTAQFTGWQHICVYNLWLFVCNELDQKAVDAFQGILRRMNMIRSIKATGKYKIQPKDNEWLLMEEIATQLIPFPENPKELKHFNALLVQTWPNLAIFCTKVAENIETEYGTFFPSWTQVCDIMITSKNGAAWLRETAKKGVARKPQKKALHENRKKGRCAKPAKKGVARNRKKGRCAKPAKKGVARNRKKGRCTKTAKKGVARNRKKGRCAKPQKRALHENRKKGRCAKPQKRALRETAKKGVARKPQKRALRETAKKGVARKPQKRALRETAKRALRETAKKGVARKPQKRALHENRKKGRCAKPAKKDVARNPQKRALHENRKKGRCAKPAKKGVARNRKKGRCTKTAKKGVARKPQKRALRETRKKGRCAKPAKKDVARNRKKGRCAKTTKIL
ncbi:hypothetical protein niasHT_026257 [Heterodera trifolii]|uniref:Uncharacterized protein n=1 Tax=Heterodera trifolii TaxID=157864 RepID=A0ABD2JN70_9BILA